MRQIGRLDEHRTERTRLVRQQPGRCRGEERHATPRRTRQDRPGDVDPGPIVELQIEQREVEGAEDRDLPERPRFGDDISPREALLELVPDHAPHERGVVHEQEPHGGKTNTSARACQGPSDVELRTGYAEAASTEPRSSASGRTLRMNQPAPPPRHDWTLSEARALHDLPLFELLDHAREVHRARHPDGKVQLCTLLSVKTGGCPEDCAYCPQSSKHEGSVDAEKMLDLEQVLASAQRAKDVGSTRFCMGAAWREVKDGPAFDKVVEMVRGVKSLGLEACATLGMLNDDQAKRLFDAGLDAYNHNLDTSRSAYKSIVSTRTYDDRLSTLRRVRAAGITVCSGGIIGMGESIDDRVSMLIELAALDPHPESVPINALVRVPGTPLAELPPVQGIELVRMVATARIMMPGTRVRLSAGRTELSEEAQLLALYAGANSIFYGDKLLTTPNPDANEDAAMLKRAGLEAAGSGPRAQVGAVSDLRNPLRSS